MLWLLPGRLMSNQKTYPAIVRYSHSIDEGHIFTNQSRDDRDDRHHIFRDQSRDERDDREGGFGSNHEVCHEITNTVRVLQASPSREEAPPLRQNNSNVAALQHLQQEIGIENSFSEDIGGRTNIQNTFSQDRGGRTSDLV